MSVREEKAELIRRHIEKLQINYEKNIIGVTMTIGVHHISQDELKEADDIDEFRSSILRKADIALYEGKKTGRNKVVLYKEQNNLKRKIRTINK